MTKPATLVLATHNPGKLAECRALLAPLGLTVRSLEELGIREEVEETGATFAANALLKANAAMAATGLPGLADDTGLEVEALDGAPGVHSARWAGPGLSAAERTRRLLERVAAVPEGARAARFVSVVAICRPDGASALARGELAGRLAWEPRGQHGFGYDSIFVLPELGRTLAELDPDEKNRLSHRGRAFAAALPLLRALLPA